MIEDYKKLETKIDEYLKDYKKNPNIGMTFNPNFKGEPLNNEQIKKIQLLNLFADACYEVDNNESRPPETIIARCLRNTAAKFDFNTDDANSFMMCIFGYIYSGIVNGIITMEWCIKFTSCIPELDQDELCCLNYYIEEVKKHFKNK